MRIISISDTHNLHKQITPPKGDMIIHAGDLTNRGTIEEVRNFLDWFSSLEHRYKIFIAGNHDFFFDANWKAKTLRGEERHNHITFSEKQIQELLAEYPSVIYLNDSFVEIEGLKIFGSPIQPWHHDWAFNRLRGEEIAKHWNIIPDDIDIMVCHGPVFRILDQNLSYNALGCEDLREKIFKLQKLKLFISGHIHEDRGEHIECDKLFLNSSMVNYADRLMNKCHKVDYKNGEFRLV